MWGVALAFKLQAVFFLPVLLVLVLQGKVKWYQPLYALGAFALLSFPPLAVGRSVKEILGVYVTQANSGLVQRLSFDAPNPYLWVPDAYFHYFNKPGVIMGLAVVLAILLVSVRAYRGSKEQLLYFATIFLLAVPFVLPQMHERYFYPAEIFSLLVAMSYPKRAWVMVAMQGITMMTYVPYLFGQTVVPLIFLPFGIAGILYRLGADLPATRQL